MSLWRYGYGQRRKLENGAVSKLLEFGHFRRRALKKCLCSGDCQMADCQSIVRSACTTVGFWKATGVQCRSGNRPPEALQGRFTIFRCTGYFQRRFPGGLRRDRSLAHLKCPPRPKCRLCRQLSPIIPHPSAQGAQKKRTGRKGGWSFVRTMRLELIQA